jgi:NADH-quinone oxidoreductase subunit N
MKYFVLGALASGLLLYGMSMIYGATGTLEITDIGQRIAAGRRPTRRCWCSAWCSWSPASPSSWASCPSTCGFPTSIRARRRPVTLFIGSAPKLAAFAIVDAPAGQRPACRTGQHWQQMLIILAVLSMAIGNLAAIAQTNIKRMLAYSTISHMGFMLLGMLSGVVGGDWHDAYALNAYSSSMFYVIAYVLMSLGAFGMILLMSRAGFEAENIDDFKGLNKRSPWFAAIMLMTDVLDGRRAVLHRLLRQVRGAAGGRGRRAVWLAVVAVLFSLIGAFYYLRIVKLMYFDAPATEIR